MAKRIIMRDDDVTYQDVHVEGGKYVVRLHDGGRIETRHHKGEWADQIGSGKDLFRAMAQAILDLREKRADEKVAKYEAELKVVREGDTVISNQELAELHEAIHDLRVESERFHAKHEYYGPCDMLGDLGHCDECLRIDHRLRTVVAEYKEKHER